MRWAMRKCDELASPESCLSKAADDEPIFVLRAHDRCAPKIVRAWVEFARSQGCGEVKLQGALDAALEMEKWARARGEEGSKWPD